MRNNKTSYVLPILALGGLSLFLIKKNSSNQNSSNSGSSNQNSNNNSTNKQNPKSMDTSNYRQMTFNILDFCASTMKNLTDQNKFRSDLTKYLPNATDQNCYGFIQYLVYGIASYKADFDAIIYIIDN